MSKQTINIGASPNDGTGTPLRTSFDYTNQNFTEIYTALGGGVALPGATTQVIFNDGGTNLAGDAGLVYNKTTDALTVAGLVTAGSATITGDLTVDTNVLKVDTTNNRVGIGTASPSGIFHAANLGTAGTSADNFSGYFSSANRNANLYLLAKNTEGSNFYFGDGDSNTVGAIVYDHTSNYMRFDVNGAEVARFNSTGNLAFPTGKGIDFSAVTGGTGTATANVLNDYEEGTWTGTIGGTTTNPTTPVTSTGRYTKIGRQVSVEIGFYGDTTGASGRITVSGLPFTSNASIGRPGLILIDTMGTFTGSPVAYLAGGVTSVDLYGSNSNASSSNVTHNAGAGRALYMQLTYTV
jgi:hypothetical protein